MRWSHPLAQLCVCASVMLVPFAAQAATEEDPWESVNRPIFQFNDFVDTYALKPLAQGYEFVTPQFVEDGIHNMFRNVGDVTNLANNVLQLKPHAAGVDTARLIVNTTFGLGGFFDVGTKMGLQRNDEDFGQTLGAWGWRSSRYVELPFFGPRTVRDVFGLAGDMPLSPIRTIEEDKVRIGLQGLQLVDMRSQLLAIDDMRANAVDEYTLVRDAWLQRRNYQIENDLRGKHARGKDADDTAPIPIDAMPMPNWGN